MTKRTCTMPECDRAHAAKGYCKAHYNKLVDTNRHAKKLTPCTWCGTEVMKGTGGGPNRRPVCSDQCRQWLVTPYCVLPKDHWARWYGKRSEWTPPAFHPEERECGWCGDIFTANRDTGKFCNKRCSKKQAKMRRRGRESNAPGQFTWAQVVKLHLIADRRCSYCDEQVAQPDPDHVIPISRGGRNGIENILPCCQSCNGDKGDMTLTEWAAYRVRKNKQPVRTTFDYRDPRFKHLMLSEATGTSLRITREGNTLAA
jgi:5-methylcytosine-specific restriction endonuclease McrA